MRRLPLMSISRRLAGASFVAVGVLAAGLLPLCGCGSGLHAGAAAGVPSSALTVAAAPKLGYVWNETDGTLRPISGVPGSAQFGESVTPAGAYVLGVADPGGNYALLLSASQAIYRMALPSGTPVLLPWQAAAGSKIRMSPQGGAAMVFVPGATVGTLLTQLSATPAGKSISSAGAIVDVAVSDAGNVAFASKASGGVSVQVIPAAGQPVTLTPLQAFGGMSFIANTDDLLLADSGANSLVRVRSASTSPASTPLQTAGLLKSPVSVAASRAAHWAVVANGSDASVIRVDLSGATPAQRTACTCQPSMVAQLASDSAFRLTPLKDGPVWISDASNPAFPVLFIPAVAAEAKAAVK